MSTKEGEEQSGVDIQGRSELGEDGSLHPAPDAGASANIDEVPPDGEGVSAESTGNEENDGAGGDGEGEYFALDESDGKHGEKQHKKKHKHGKHSKHKHTKTELKHIILFICDPQCDFLKEGPMPIPNSKQDSIRIADMIMSHIHEITEIYVSLDSRHKTHISNPISWVNENGETPEEYTEISREDVENGKYRARMNVLQERFSKYVTTLAELNKDPLILWPEHCLVGTEGHAITPEINEALQEWAGKNMATVEYIIKGTNVSTEMYSAISAEVEIENDPSTSLDLAMVERLSMCDRVIICGQSLSHTVNHTLRDLSTHWNPDSFDKIFLLKDCTSALPGFESVAESFLQDMRSKGISLTSSLEAFIWDDSDSAGVSSSEALDNDAAEVEEKSEIHAEGEAIDENTDQGVEQGANIDAQQENDFN